MNVVSTPLDAVAALTAAVGSAQTLPSIYEAALNGLQQGFGAERASILLFDSDGVMRFKAWRGISDEYRKAVEGHTPWTVGQSTPEPVVVADVRDDSSLSNYWGVFDREGIASLAFFPLIAAGKVIGKFMLYQGTRTVFSVEEITAGKAMGFLLGFAVERTQRVQDADREHQRLLFALDAASMGTWDWDVRTQDVRWSSNLERIHGLPEGAFSGGFDSYRREIHPDDRTRVLASLQHALDTAAPHDVEYRIVAPDGTVRWVHGKGRAERDDDGAPIRMTGVCMDISPRRRIEDENRQLLENTERLLRDEETLRSRLTVLTDGSFSLLTSPDSSVFTEVIALTAKVIHADAYAVWTRRGNEWRVGASRGLSDAFTSVTLPYDGQSEFQRPIIAPDFQSAPVLSTRTSAFAAEGIESLFTVPLAARGILTGSIAFYYRARHEPSEGELRVAVALGNLAAAAISNAELYEEQQQLRMKAEATERRTAFLADTSASLSSLDYEANLREVSQLAVARLCDWCAIDLLDRDGSVKRVSINHADPEKVALAQGLARRRAVSLDDPRGIGYVLRTGHPELYPVIPDEMLVNSASDEDHLRTLREVGIHSAMLVPLAAGSRVFGTISLVNSKQRRPFDDADLAFACELGRRMAFAIENARLYAEARNANRLKDEFLATLSHELRTPLNVIAGRTKMLMTATDIETAQQFAQIVDRNVTTLTRLVDDLLDVSRMTIGQVKLERQNVDVAAVLSAAAQVIQSAAEAKTITVNVTCAPALTIAGDATRIQQVMWNLLSNAVKFTPAGGTVDVTATLCERTVTITVRDSGEGIAPDVLARIFDMFWQAEASTTRRHGGLGLGLSIAKKLVELHGGELQAESDGPGQGSTFTVRLPVGAL